MRNIATWDCVKNNTFRFP